MERLRGRKPSPAMVVSIIALIFALAGSAAAGVATISVLSKKEKKQTSNIAKNEINKAAPGLSVANATNAQNASAVGGIPPSQIGAVGRTNFEPSTCFDDDHNGTDCTSVDLQFPRSGRALVIATATAEASALDDPSGPGSGGDFTNQVAGSCQVVLDGVEIGASAPVSLVSVAVTDGLALNRVTFPLDPGLHTFALRCTEIDGIIFWEEASISAVMLGSD